MLIKLPGVNGIYQQPEPGEEMEGQGGQAAADGGEMPGPEQAEGGAPPVAGGQHSQEELDELGKKAALAQEADRLQKKLESPFTGILDFLKKLFTFGKASSTKEQLAEIENELKEMAAANAGQGEGQDSGQGSQAGPGQDEGQKTAGPGSAEPQQDAQAQSPEGPAGGVSEQSQGSNMTSDEQGANTFTASGQEQAGHPSDFSDFNTGEGQTLGDSIPPEQFAALQALHAAESGHGAADAFSQGVAPDTFVGEGADPSSPPTDLDPNQGPSRGGPGGR